MVDGKVCNALSGTSSTKCYKFKAKPTEINNIENYLSKKVYESRYEFGWYPHTYNVRLCKKYICLYLKGNVRTQGCSTLPHPTNQAVARNQAVAKLGTLPSAK